MQPYVVATNADFTVIVMANNEDEALDMAIQYYADAYGDERDDWEVYDLLDYMGPDDVLEI